MTDREAIKAIEVVQDSDYHYDETIGYQLTSYDFDWLEKAKQALQEREERSKEGKSLREKIERYKIESGFVSATPEERAMFAESLIDTLKSLDIPTIDTVPVVHGRWEHTHTSSSYYSECWKCSVCGFEDTEGYDFRFCPTCGAKMDLED